MYGLVGLLLLLLLAALVAGPAAWIRISSLERRLAGVEAALLRLLRERGEAPAEPAAEPAPAPRQIIPKPAPAPAPAPSAALENVVGQKWLGWIAVVLIFLAAGFFLKYAFENRWIGELGRVMLGVIAGLAFTAAGLERYRRGWRYFSQILTTGGVTLLYLSTYGAFGYYHLIDQRSAFAFLAIVVAETHLLALYYDAPAIALAALLGGFLVPVLLSTGRDVYQVLFTYLVILDLGVVGVVTARRWRWVGTIAFAGTHALFWAWYGEHYHPEKRVAALVFQTVVFLIFLAVGLAPHLWRQASTLEEWIRLAGNAFVFYGTCYSLLDNDHHDWMGAFALLLATAYAAVARLELALNRDDRRMLLVTVGTALTFVTLAIPVQLESNWITIGWALEALAILWAGFETGAGRLRDTSMVVFALAVGRLVFWDTPWRYRPTFTPVLNRYFLGMLAVTACLVAAAYLARRQRGGMALVLVAAGVFWLGSSIETYTYFDSQAAALQPNAGASEAARQLRWAGQMAVSILWSLFAAALTGAGFRFGVRLLRILGLALFGLTVLKVVAVDISELRQFYRILALLALGLLLLWAAWAYNRFVRRERAG